MPGSVDSTPDWTTVEASASGARMPTSASPPSGVPFARMWASALLNFAKPKSKIFARPARVVRSRRSFVQPDFLQPLGVVGAGAGEVIGTGEFQEHYSAFPRFNGFTHPDVGLLDIAESIVDDRDGMSGDIFLFRLG